jgi:hypothetical protein
MEEHVKTQGKDRHPSVKEMGLRRNQPCRHLDLGLLTPKMKREWEREKTVADGAQMEKTEQQVENLIAFLDTKRILALLCKSQPQAL